MNKNELVEDRMTAESEPMRFTLGLGDGLPALEPFGTIPRYANKKMAFPYRIDRAVRLSE